jgi:tetratricopeptide (TPR) repeat protein
VNFLKTTSLTLMAVCLAGAGHAQLSLDSPWPLEVTQPEKQKASPPRAKARQKKPVPVEKPAPAQKSAQKIRPSAEDRDIEDANRVLEFNPNDLTAHLQRGSALLRKGEYDKAIADLDRALELDANSSVALQGRRRLHPRH